MTFATSICHRTDLVARATLDLAFSHGTRGRRKCTHPALCSITAPTTAQKYVHASHP